MVSVCVVVLEVLWSVEEQPNGSRSPANQSCPRFGELYTSADSSSTRTAGEQLGEVAFATTERFVRLLSRASAVLDSGNELLPPTAASHQCSGGCNTM